jgi:hypothetical protein
MKRLISVIGLIALSSTAFGESAPALMAPDDHELVDSSSNHTAATEKNSNERNSRFKGNRIPGSWSLMKPKAGGPVGQAEQMLQDGQRPRLLPAESQMSPVFVGTCQTAQGASFISQQDQRNYERCMDQSNRKSGGTTLFSIPNPLTN